MALNTHFNNIRSRVSNQIATGETVTVLYDNDPTAKPANTKWVRCTIVPLERHVNEFGTSPLYKLEGELILQCYVPVDDGESTLLPLVDACEVAFAAVTADNVRYTTPYSLRMGRVGGEYQIDVHCPFYIHETL